LKKGRLLLIDVSGESFTKGTMTIGDLRDFNAAAVTNKYNHSADRDFEGLSPHQMNMILNKPFSPDCPVKYKNRE